MRNQPVRIIGYGLNKHFQQTGAGVKRTATVKLSSYDSMFIRTGLWNKGICNGDSGGPDLMNINGRKTIVGINSFGMVFCFGKSSSTRDDTYQSFIDQYVP